MSLKPEGEILYPIRNTGLLDQNLRTMLNLLVSPWKLTAHTYYLGTLILSHIWYLSMICIWYLYTSNRIAFQQTYIRLRLQNLIIFINLTRGLMFNCRIIHIQSNKILSWLSKYMYWKCEFLFCGLPFMPTLLRTLLSHSFK